PAVERAVHRSVEFWRELLAVARQVLGQVLDELAFSAAPVDLADVDDDALNRLLARNLDDGFAPPALELVARQPRGQDPKVKMRVAALVVARRPLEDPQPLCGRDTVLFPESIQDAQEALPGVAGNLHALADRLLVEMRNGEGDELFAPSAA